MIQPAMSAPARKPRGRPGKFTKSGLQTEKPKGRRSTKRDQESDAASSSDSNIVIGGGDPGYIEK